MKHREGDILDDYPKRRIALPKAYKEVYEEHYLANRDGKSNVSSVSSKLERWLHKKVAADVQTGSPKSTLEIGAGTLNQLAYEPSADVYDVVEPSDFFYRNSPYINRVRTFYPDIHQVPLTHQYERITAVATFEHIAHLPDMVAHTCLRLQPGGTLRVSIPNEGELMWTLGWKLTSGIEFRLKYGLKYGLLMRYEHLSTADEIEQVLASFYGKMKCSVFGLNKTIAFYRFYECSEPNVAHARHYLGL